MSDPITKYDKEATENHQKKEFHTRNHTFYGQYEFVPIQKDKQREIEEAFDRINKLVAPTTAKLNSVHNVAEIQEKIYLKLAPWESQLNNCLFKAKDIRDSNYCSDEFLKKVNGEGRDFIVKLLKEY